jgi:hypothetical protein
LRIGFLGKQRPNLLEHAPSGFVSDASLALNLFGRDAAASRTHKENRVEPSLERSGGLFKDGSRERINLSAAVVTAKGGATLNAVMLSLNATLDAVGDAARKTLLHHVIEARIIIRKFFVEVPMGVAEFFGNVLFDRHRYLLMNGA